MVTSFLTILYEDLLTGEQVDVQTTVNEGLLKGEQADVYTYRSSISCGLIPSMFLRCKSYLRAVLMFLARVPGQALQQLLKEEESNKEDEEGGKGGKEEDKREISCTRIDESSFLPCAYR